MKFSTTVQMSVYSFFNRYPRLYPLILLSSICVLWGCGTGTSKSNGLGPLEDYVFLGPVEGWHGSMQDGVYWLENQSGGSGDIRYFYTPYRQDDNGRRSASIDVNVATMHADGRAGLLYGFRDSPKYYQLIVVSGNGNLEMYRRDNSGFEMSLSSSISLGSADYVHLEISEKGRELTIKANGKSVSSIENDQVGQGLVGMAAFGPGRFGFTNYRQDPSGDRSESGKVDSGNGNQSNASQTVQKRNVEYLDFRDREMGMVQHSTPFPPGWKYDNNPNDQLQLIGPNGTEVYQTGSGQFAYSNDPFTRQSAQMSGAQVAPVMSLNQYIAQRFAPYMQQRGYRLSNQFPMPEIRDFWEVFGAAMPQGLSRRQYDVMGAEWERGDGSKAFTILIQNVLTRQQMVTWTVSAGELYASSEAYDKAKDDYIYASSNIRVNPKWQIAKNDQLLAQIRADTQMWDERMRQSRIQHIGRMNSILARSETSSSVAKINSDILDINHAGYLKRSDMVSTGQANSVNMIGEQSVISNPNTGEMYKVDAGYNNYWVNGDGKYFHTDNSNYDPRTDNSINNQQWERFEVMR